MFGQKFYPYSTLQELNLDWILTKVKNILRFVPDDGVVGQILRRTPDGAEWSNETGGGGTVDSVNGQTGTVVLTASDVGALPDSYTAPVTSVNTKTGAVVLDKTDIGLGNVANVAQYSASNPPPYPVTSVNTKTGAVVLDKTDIGLGNVANVAQYSASNPPPYPVTSVNGQTGAVTIATGGRDLLWTNPNPNSSFNPQEVVLPTHSHTSYQIVCKFRNNVGEILGPFECMAGENSLMSYPAASNIQSGTFTGIIIREAVTTATSITFSAGQLAYTSATQNNDYMIPLRIYRID